MRLIDADDLKGLEEMEYIYFYSPAAVPFYKAHAVWDLIDNAPTIDAVPVVHGRWVFGSVNGHEYMKCSECLKSQTPTGVFAYCPNCGARMEGDG